MFSLFGILKGILLQDTADRTKQLEINISPSATTGTKTTLIAAQTANRTITLPDSDFDFNDVITEDSVSTLTNKTIDGDDNTLQDISLTSLKTVLADANKFVVRDGSGVVVSSNTVPSGTVVGTTDSQVLTNKTIDADLSTITNIDNNEIKALAAIDATKIANGSVSNTEFQFLDGVTSSIQTQLTTNANDIANHIADAVDAHDASAISNIPSGNLSATDVQGALDELQTNIDDLDGANVGTGAGLAFKQRSGNDFQFRSIKAGTGVTVTNNTDDITIDASASGANTTLSNLTSPTSINQDLIPSTSGTFNLGSTAKSWLSLFVDSINALAGGTLSIAATTLNLTAVTTTISSSGETRTGNSQNLGLRSQTVLKFYENSNINSAGFRAPASVTASYILNVPPNSGTSGQYFQTDGANNIIWAELITRAGNTASRPVGPVLGQQYFDTDLGIPIWYDGTNWVDATGATV